MEIVAIDHIQLAMPPGEEEKARDFYRDILGVSEKPKPPHLAVRGGCWFEDGTVKIHLGVEKDFKPARKAHPAWLVRDHQMLRDRLSAAGYEVYDDEPLEGYHRFYASDPFGNRLEFIEPEETKTDRST